MSQTYWWQVNTANCTGTVSRTDPEREIVHREVSFELEAEGDGRTLYTRIVPYNTPIEVKDSPYQDPYIETWKPGVFDKQLRAANRVDVLLNYEHEKGIGGVVGRGVELRSQPDGLHGTFRLLASSDGEKTRELVNEKVLTGMSLEALIIKSSREPNGVVARTEARLQNVAICRRPAFPGAEILAVRTEGEDEPLPQEPQPDEPQPDEPAPEEPGVVVSELLVARNGISDLLEKVGVVRLEKITVVRGRWDSNTARFDDEQYAASCLIDRGGDGTSKERCSLPVFEPTGELNYGALVIASRQLATTTGVTNVQRAEAARRMVRLYRIAGDEPPASTLDAARR